MKRKMLNNLGLKIIAVICAILLWLIVMNISDYSITVQIDDIPVEELNADVLEELDRVYDVIKGDTVDIIVRGRRSVVEQLSAEDFKATADLSTMSITNTVNIKVVPIDSDIEGDITITCVDNTMQLNLENIVEEQFQIVVESTGNTAEGYTVGELIPAPLIVNVQGPESTVEKITTAVVTVDVTDAKKNFEIEAPIELYDAYDELISSDKIIMAYDTANVSVLIYPEKEITINLDVKGTPEGGFAVSEVSYQPTKVVIAAPEEQLDSITSVLVDNISISGHNADLETTVDLLDYLPEGVVISDNVSTLAVTVGIEPLLEHSVSVLKGDVTLTGKEIGYTYDVAFSDDFKVIANGIEESVSDIAAVDIKPTIDCSELYYGNNNNVEITFKDIEGITYTVEGFVSVKVSNK